MNFKNDLLFGEKYQQELINILKPQNYEIKKGKFKEYDIKIDDVLTIYYEVKADRKAYQTNNLCIEYKCNNVSSGINATTADYYAYFIINPDSKYTLYIIPVKDIKKLIKQQKYTKDTKGGDKFKSCFYIFNKEIFKEYIYKI